MDLGNKITELRKINKLSQEELAAKLDISRQSISLWETNQSKPSTKKLIGLTKIFNVKIDDLINSDLTENYDSIIVRTVHSESSYKALVRETSNIFFRHLGLITVTIAILLISFIINGSFSLEYGIFVVLFLLIGVPIIFVVAKYFKKIRARKSLDFSKKNIQKFIFDEDELIIYFEDEKSKNESKVKYDAFKKALITNNYLYLEHPSMKRKYFQIDLHDFLQGDKESLVRFLSKKNINLITKRTKKVTKEKILKDKKLYTNKKLYFSLLGSIVLTVIMFFIVIMSFNKASSELDSYYSARISLDSMMFYSLFIIPFIAVLIFSIYLAKNKYKSKLIILSYIIVPLVVLMTLAFTIVNPLVYKGTYSKDYDSVKKLFNNGNLYLPEEGLSVSIKRFNVDEDNKTNLPYTESHKVLLTAGIATFENELIDNPNWVTNKTLPMKAKLNLFIDKEATYYLIYNETANNYNDGELEQGLNKLYVFYYFNETNEVFIYEFYLLN